MNLNKRTKLQKGFDKQVERQRQKQREKTIELPMHPNLPKNFKGDYKNYFTVYNSIWNGMNLNQLRNRLYINRVGGMYGKFTIKQNGKYALSIHGKDLLRKRKLK
jgi:hypothetical protein